MTPPKKIYPTELDVLQTKIPKYRVATHEYISVDALKEWAKQQPQLYQSNVARINVTQAMEDLETFLNSEE